MCLTLSCGGGFHGEDKPEPASMAVASLPQKTWEWGSVTVLWHQEWPLEHMDIPQGATGLSHQNYLELEGWEPRVKWWEKAWPESGSALEEDPCLSWKSIPSLEILKENNLPRPPRRGREPPAQLWSTSCNLGFHFLGNFSWKVRCSPAKRNKEKSILARPREYIAGSSLANVVLTLFHSQIILSARYPHQLRGGASCTNPEFLQERRRDVSSPE